MLQFVRLAVFIALPIFARFLLAAEDTTSKLQNAQPSAVAGDSPTSTQPAQTENLQSDNADRPDKWRYRWQGGRWWYWTAKNSWLYWSEPQGWVAYQPPAAGAAAPAVQAQPRATRAPTGDSWRWGWDPANPFDRHPPGRPLNAPRMFPKNM